MRAGYPRTGAGASVPRNVAASAQPVNGEEQLYGGGGEDEHARAAAALLCEA
jgi:hypothetical protein